MKLNFPELSFWDLFWALVPGQGSKPDLSIQSTMSLPIGNWTFISQQRFSTNLSKGYWFVVIYNENFLKGWFWPNIYTDLALFSRCTCGVPKRLVMTINVWKINRKKIKWTSVYSQMLLLCYVVFTAYNLLCAHDDTLLLVASLVNARY